MKKIIIIHLPYLLFVYLFGKLLQFVRLMEGDTLAEKLLSLTDGNSAFDSFAPSIYPTDLLIGLIGAVIVRGLVYIKTQNAKKYRKGIEYGSARWGNSQDIKPYMDLDAKNNIILTQTEGLMMSNRPKNPKYARNKNVLVVGGSGSGKTRFYVKPNLMQMHSSYVVSDPNGYNIVG